MSTQPLRVTVYPNLKVDGASGDPFINTMVRSMQQALSAPANNQTQNQDKDGWNPFNLFQLPNFNMNALWLFAIAFLVVVLLMSKGGK
jgi:hypothetical protein